MLKNYKIKQRQLKVFFQQKAQCEELLYRVENRNPESETMKHQSGVQILNSISSATQQKGQVTDSQNREIKP